MGGWTGIGKDFIHWAGKLRSALTSDDDPPDTLVTKSYADSLTPTTPSWALVLRAGNNSAGSNAIMTSTDRMNFRDASLAIWSPLDGTLRIDSDNSLFVSASNVVQIPDGFNVALPANPGESKVFGVSGSTAEMRFNRDGTTSGFMSLGFASGGVTFVDYFKVWALGANAGDLIITNGNAGLSFESTSGNFEVSGAVACSSVNTGNGAVELAAGTYTPTLTTVANLDASGAYVCHYCRVGDVVNVGGAIDLDPTIAGLTRIRVSLPIASNFANVNECAGTICRAGTGTGVILPDKTNNEAEINLQATVTTNQTYYFNFSYFII